jgi:hypothetical protein
MGRVLTVYWGFAFFTGCSVTALWFALLRPHDGTATSMAQQNSITISFLMISV